MIEFREPKLKVKRANQHITDLNKEILTYIRRKPYVMVVDAQTVPGQVSLRVKQRIKLPEHWPLVIGDAIHNLRSALDILACDVMRFHQRGVASVHFPFAKSPEELEATIRHRTLHRASPAVVDLFRELQPYPGGNDLLLAIHDFDVRDKHKLINPVTNIGIVSGVQVLWPNGTPMLTMAPGSQIIVGGDKNHGIVAGPIGTKFNGDRKVHPEIRFGDGPLKQYSVVPTLYQLSQLVEEVISRFEGCINDPRPPILLGYNG